ARRLGAGSHLALLKGAADSVLEACGSVWAEGDVQPLDQEHRSAVLEANDELASRGQRVLGLAVRWIDGPPGDETAEILERDFVFLGLAGLMDPPRAEARQAVERCKSAGIRPVMITGDHPLTARHVAAAVGIEHSANSLTGPE